jgi:hypothetical protein
MSKYEYWVDADENAHIISKMDTQYIQNCLNQLRKWLDAWHGIIPEQLTAKELKKKDEVGMKAWFVFNGIGYIDAFVEEINKRMKEDRF